MAVAISLKVEQLIESFPTINQEEKNMYWLSTKLLSTCDSEIVKLFSGQILEKITCKPKIGMYLCLCAHSFRLITWDQENDRTTKWNFCLCFRRHLDLESRM